MRLSLASLIWFAMLSVATHAQTQQVEKLRLWHSPDRTRIVFDVSSSMEYQTFMLTHPDRLVIDLEQVNLSVALPEIEKRNRHVTSVRSGTPKEGVLRVVFDLKRSVDVNSFVLTPNELYGHRLVVDLTDENAVVGDSADPQFSEEEAIDQKSATPTPVVVQEPRRLPSKFIVAIDAGHGGDDPGAIGHRGSREKALTLSIARQLQHRINQNPNMKAVMVRTGDYYIKLRERREKARQQGADIFVSIHADAFTKQSAHGMSVFALSQRGATSAMARTLAEKENASDLIGGVSLADKDEVLRKVLVDLSMTNTISESVNLGGRVLRELGKLGKLHSRRVEQANFSVLRSADVPSILVETGFITNPSEERKLRSSRHQTKLANAIYLAIKEYYEQTPYSSDSRYDSPSVAALDNQSRSTQSASTSNSVQYGRYTVKRGDSLSKIADRHGVSLTELKRLNKLKHNTAMLGAKLKVPIKASATTSVVSSGTSSSNQSLVHTVRNGESLSIISAKYNVTIRAIKRHNQLRSDALRKGQKLVIPGVTAQVVAKEVRHKVARGDTLSEIAERYGSSIAKIKQANKMRSNTVRLGQVLTIPN